MLPFQTLFYILKGRQPVAVEDVIRWGIWMEKAHVSGERNVGLDHIQDLTVSTVFLGIDYGWGASAPVLFETLVFWEYEKPVTKNILGRLMTFDREPLDDTMRRYCTWDEAETGHKQAVKEARLKFMKEVNRNG